MSFLFAFRVFEGERGRRHCIKYGTEYWLGFYVGRRVGIMALSMDVRMYVCTVEPAAITCEDRYVDSGRV